MINSLHAVDNWWKICLESVVASAITAKVMQRKCLRPSKLVQTLNLYLNIISRLTKFTILVASSFLNFLVIFVTKNLFAAKNFKFFDFEKFEFVNQNFLRL